MCLLYYLIGQKQLIQYPYFYILQFFIRFITLAILLTVIKKCKKIKSWQHTIETSTKNTLIIKIYIKSSRKYILNNQNKS
ncbi:transmembrane protein, putative (macronuclear) [Tetrahymena thermophila SB210]|uniref:Transmembrane protein, putative n=1 Tax=Tetrahymena thermophila (strain SB210) TaxID=312017 RepID=W7X7A3_TETTS|nr:transmembrane protein, putative [Tetrahymena thermophila SB210]EWS72268.1 transmembrane protein, putative [Tetrahymena thermophila SB210]|eukprot:XP_012655208.1 transmembrane protein, putative [Tetrahymena thermophila SB210]